MFELLYLYLYIGIHLWQLAIKLGVSYASQVANGDGAHHILNLERLKATAGQLHSRVLKLKLGTSVQIKDSRSVSGEVADGGNLDGSLVLVPALGLRGRRRVLIRAVVGGGGLGASVLNHGARLLVRSGL